MRVEAGDWGTGEVGDMILGRLVMLTGAAGGKAVGRPGGCARMEPAGCRCGIGALVLPAGGRQSDCRAQGRTGAGGDPVKAVEIKKSPVPPVRLGTARGTGVFGLICCSGAVCRMRERGQFANWSGRYLDMS